MGKVKEDEGLAIAAAGNVDDYYGEMSLWLDGTPIANQDQANKLAALIANMRKAKTEAEDAKGTEKRPHLDANIAIEARYKPLVTKAETAIKVALAAQTTWQVAQQKVIDDLAKAAREKAAAEEKAAADAAAAATRAGNLEAREQAEELVTAAKETRAEAEMLDNTTTVAREQGMTRGISLTTVYDTVISDERAAFRHYWTHLDRRYHDEIMELVLDFAKKDVRAGARHLDGFTITSRQEAR
jgi:hypothetical protein